MGSRIHRPNAERRCLAVFENGEICVEIQNLEHLFIKCKEVESINECMKWVLETFLDRTVSLEDMIYFSFNHRNKKKLALALWFSVKMMFKIFQDKCRNKSQLLREVIKSIDWNLSMNRKMGSAGEMMKLKEVILTFLRERGNV